MKPYIPTPEEIAKEAAAIRETWTPRERILRSLAGGERIGVTKNRHIAVMPWEPPVVRCRVA